MMLFKRHAVLIVAFLMFSTSAFSDKVDAEKARKVATNWYQHYAPASKQQASITKVKGYKWGDRTSFYICSFDQGGFVIVSANDQVTPILGYGFEHGVPDEITNEAVKGWFDGYARQIDTAFVLNLRSDEESAKWNEIIMNNFPDSQRDAVEPLLTTTWDQGCYYNEMCPADPDGACGHVPVGCTATAMAQIMKYWNYPEGGVGMHSYIPRNNQQYGQLTVFFNETNYDWTAMPNNVSSQNEAVATLMYHVGVSAQMEYSPYSSGAHLYKALIGFEENFDYSDSISQIYRSELTDSTWMQMLQNNINLGRPVLLDGYNEARTLGHAFVCDGYDSQNFFHINWGWSGSSDGYWNIDDLTPGYNFSYHQSALINIFPEYSPLTSRFYSIRTDTNYQVQFIDNSLGNPDTFIWHFGDSTSLPSQNPYHIYADTGNYLVTLIVGKNNIYDTTQNWVHIYRDPFLLSNTALAGNDSKIMAIDYNIDGYQDILISGISSQQLYKNNGENFTEIQMNLSSSLSPSFIHAADIENNGFPDLIVSGQRPFNGSIDLLHYLNNVNGVLNLDTLVDIPLHIDYPFSFMDYNNDGKTDILLGNNLYKRLGNKRFSFQGIIGDELAVSSWADYDLDGDLDVAIGTQIYRNEGNGEFYALAITVPSYSYHNDWRNYSLSWGDFNKDGLPDLLSGGSILINDGDDNFSEILLNINSNNIQSICGDIDNDGDLDIIALASYSTKILINTNGQFTLTKSNLHSFNKLSSINWIDYNNDNKLDLLMTGLYHDDSTGSGINFGSYLYNNNSVTNNFPPTPPNGLMSDTSNNDVTIAWNRSVDDFTNTNGLTYNIRIGTTPHGCDIYSSLSDSLLGHRFVMSRGNTCQDTSWTIKNLLNGKYYWSVQSLDNSYIASDFSVIDSFNIIGNNMPSELIPTSQNVYLNIPSYLSSQKILDAFYDPENDSLQSIRIDSLPVHGTLTYDGIPVVQYQTLPLSDVENLSYITNNFTNDYFYICPYDGNSWGLKSSRYDINVMLFKELDGQISDELSAFAWGDYDNDGDLDLASTTKIFRSNNGNLQDIGIVLTGNGSVNWGDIDSDGDLDLIIGEKTYRNDGNDQFNNWQLLSPVLNESASSLGDANSNNKPDYLNSGLDSNSAICASKIFVNQEIDEYSDSAINLLGFKTGAVEWGDYDNDGDQDIAICGMCFTNNERKTIIYRNENGQFVDIEAEILGVNVGTLDWGDYDCDGDLDLLICGSPGTVYNAITRIYRNNDGVFEYSYSNQLNFPGVFRGFAKWVDVDADGYLDIILGGFLNYPSRAIKLYKNIDAISFTELKNSNLPNIAFTSCSIGDFDNDGFPDFYLSGSTENNETINAVYRNCYGVDSAVINTPPSAPTNLQTNQTLTGIIFQWDKSDDDSTPQEAISYNIYVYSLLDSSYVVSPLADTSSGFRKIVGIGNTSLKNSFKLDSLPIGTYCWSVQAIDNSFAGGIFAEQQSFSIPYFTAQQVSFTTGWNMTSFYVYPAQTGFDSIFSPIINSGNLLKVINESGGFIQNIPGVGWLNTIGDMENTEGYYIKVNDNDSMIITGTKVALPCEIPLQTGWNIMGYPVQTDQDALTVLQPIINTGSLEKLINETGGFIQNIPDIGWHNTIGDFESSKGYYIKVTSNETLTIGESPLSWQCGDAIVDSRDGQAYNTVQIGSQCWMAENLNIGTMINGTNNQTNNSIVEKYCYNNDLANGDVYGGLYQWDEMMQYINTEGGQGICPSGWHLPTNSEWTYLTGFLGGAYDAGGKMKEIGTTHWYSPNIGATNASGFTALPGGHRSCYGYFDRLGNNTAFWSSEEYLDTDGGVLHLSREDGRTYSGNINKTFGLSVRCVKD